MNKLIKHINILNFLVLVAFLAFSGVVEAQVPITRGGTSFASSFTSIVACGPNQYTTSFIQQSWNNFRITYYYHGTEIKSFFCLLLFIYI